MTAKNTTRRKRQKVASPDEPIIPVVPQWAVQPYLFQQILLKWFEVIYGGLKEIHEVLERIDEKLNKE